VPASDDAPTTHEGHVDLDGLLREVAGSEPSSGIDEGTRVALAALAYRHGPHWDDDELGAELRRMIEFLRLRQDAPLELGFYSVASALLKRLQDHHGEDPYDVLRAVAFSLRADPKQPRR
jgi:hypothetical protein